MSPVVGLSDIRRLPRLGMIRLGVKEQGAKGEYPKAVDYFVCPPEVQAVHGEKPTSLPILLPSNEQEDNFSVWLKQYGSSKGLICKGDGLTAQRVNPETGEIIDITCGYRDCERFTKGDCKAIGVLSFVLPEVPGFGVWQIATGSFNTVVNMQSEMQLAKTLLDRLTGIPFNLTIEPQEVAPGGKKKTVHVLHLRTNLVLAELTKAPALPPAAWGTVPPTDDMPEDLYPPSANGGAVEEENTPPAAPLETEGPTCSWEVSEGQLCGVKLNQAQSIYSRHNFGQLLCPEHQAAAKVREVK